MDRKCPVCLQEVGDAHSCIKCNKFIHVICGTGEGEEGYCQKVTCNKCRDVGKYRNYLDFNYAIVFLLIKTHIYVCLYCYC